VASCGRRAVACRSCSRSRHAGAIAHATYRARGRSALAGGRSPMCQPRKHGAQASSSSRVRISARGELRTARPPAAAARMPPRAQRSGTAVGTLAAGGFRDAKVRVRSARRCCPVWWHSHAEVGARVRRQGAELRGDLEGVHRCSRKQEARLTCLAYRPPQSADACPRENVAAVLFSSGDRHCDEMWLMESGPRSPQCLHDTQLATASRAIARSSGRDFAARDHPMCLPTRWTGPR